MNKWVSASEMMILAERRISVHRSEKTVVVSETVFYYIHMHFSVFYCIHRTEPIPDSKYFC